MKYTLAVISLLFISTASHSQDTLLLMNGQELLCRIMSDTNTVIVMEMTKKNGKVKVKEIHKSDIFSVTKEGQQETVLYFQNEMFGDVFTEEEMRFYLAGESDSRANYKARHVFIIGILACGGVAYWGGDGYFTAVVPPLLFTGTQLIGKIKIREKTISDPAYKYNDIYSMGYEPTARSKRLIRATQGGFLGSALGVAIWFLLGKK